MSKIIYDVIQRFEVENGVPRLVSTNIQVIQGGEDLMSLATNMLEELGINGVFEQNRTSQYIGYRNIYSGTGKGAKRYQMVLAQRKDSLCISIPKKIFEPYLLHLQFSELLSSKKHEKSDVKLFKLFWIIPSQEDIFFEISNGYNKLLDGESVGIFNLDEVKENPNHYIERLTNSNCCLNVSEDTLFPYTWQVTVNSRVVLKDFLETVAAMYDHFVTF